MNHKLKSGMIVKLVLIMSIIFGSILMSGCSVKEPEICDYNAVCADNETDNCADCKEVLGRDVKDATGNVIFYDGNNV